MTSRQELRADETRTAILAAASQLFADKGFEAVTMREIAKGAGCSHTAIYIYFKDKEALLHQLAMGPLAQLRAQMEATLQNEALLPPERLRALCREFIAFCLPHRHIYALIFMARASRVDSQAPELPINQARIQLFGLLMKGLGALLPADLGEQRLLAYARITFFTLHGVVTTYLGAEERPEALQERLGPTFDLAVDVLLAGITKTGGERS